MAWMTQAVLATLDLLLLIVGLTLLNWVFKPKHYQSIDIIFLAVCLAYLMFLASWAMALNYGVEML